MNSTATEREEQPSGAGQILLDDDDEGPLHLCHDWHIVLDPIGEPLPGKKQTCQSCGFPAGTAYYVLSDHPPGFIACLRDEYRVQHGLMLNYRKIAHEHGVLIPLCSIRCYAQYVVESLRIPATPLQRFFRPFVVLADEVQELLH
jgi:hypothetical protein